MADAQLTVQATSSRERFRDASALYARVFGYTSADHSLNPKLLSAIVANGGTAVAASTAEGALVGFAYGFVGFDGQRTYLYSQATFIDPDYQGLGVGRLLKQEQARIAARAGLASMRWAFDPILSRNAHFNLDVLGARGVRFAPRYYDEAFSDRLIVDWDLGGFRGGQGEAAASAASSTPPGAAAVRPELPASPRTFTPDDWGRAFADGDAGADGTGGASGAGADGAVIRVPIPAANPETSLDPVHVEALRFALAETFTDLFARGYVAEHCTKVDDTSATYLFVPGAAVATTDGGAS